MLKFAAVRFLATNEMAVVPNDWIVGKDCYWPKKINARNLEDYIKSMPQPSNAWPKYKVEVWKAMGKC